MSTLLSGRHPHVADAVRARDAADVVSAVHLHGGADVLDDFRRPADAVYLDVACVEQGLRQLLDVPLVVDGEPQKVALG